MSNTPGFRSCYWLLRVADPELSCVMEKEEEKSTESSILMSQVLLLAVMGGNPGPSCVVVTEKERSTKNSIPRSQVTLHAVRDGRSRNEL